MSRGWRQSCSHHPLPILSLSRVRALPGTGLALPALAGPRLRELHVCYSSPEDFTQSQICSRFKGVPAQRSQLTVLLYLQLTTPLEHLAATWSDWRETLPVLPTSADRKKSLSDTKIPSASTNPRDMGGVQAGSPPCRQQRWLDRAHRSQWEEDHGSPRMLHEPRMSHTSMQLFLKQLVC